MAKEKKHDQRGEFNYNLKSPSLKLKNMLKGK